MFPEAASRVPLVVNTSRNCELGETAVGFRPQSPATMMSPVSSSVMAKSTGPPTGSATDTLSELTVWLMTIQGWVRTALLVGSNRSTAEPAPAENTTAGFCSLWGVDTSCCTPVWEDGCSWKV